MNYKNNVVQVIVQPQLQKFFKVNGPMWWGQQLPFGKSWNTKLSKYIFFIHYKNNKLAFALKLRNKNIKEKINQTRDKKEFWKIG